MKRGVVGPIALGVALIGLSLSSSVALAARDFESQITGFANPWGLAIDANDNVWVSDTGTGLITTHDASGAVVAQQDGAGHWLPYFLRSIGVSPTGYLYVADSYDFKVHVFDDHGNFVDQWRNFDGQVYVAIDSSGGPSNGRIYVAQTESDFEGRHALVQALDADGSPVKFTAEASYVKGNTLAGTPDGFFGQPTFRPWNITVDRHGNIYVIDQGKRVVDVFAPSGEFIRAFKGEGTPGGFSGNLTGVAVDPTNDNVLVVDQGNGAIYEFGSTGTFIGEIKGTSPSSPFGTLNGGIVVDSNGELYVADGSNQVVDHFSSHIPLPKVTYGLVTNQTQTSATFNANVDPHKGGDVTACHFEYGPTIAYGVSVPCSPAIPPVYAGPTSVSANISGLTPEQVYRYRVVVSNANGTKRGPSQTFTPHAVAAVTTGAATEIGPGQATVSGSFVGNGEDTHYYFEWGPTAAYSNKTPAPPGTDAGSAAGLTQVSAVVTGLTSLTTFHYRLVATNSFGTSVGGDQTLFTALPTMPLVISSIASNPSQTTVGVQAQIKPGFGMTIYRVEYGPSTSYGTRTLPSASIGSDDSPHSVSTTLAGLSSATTYHFRVLATNFAGTTKGPDGTFTTSDIPRINSVLASNLAPSGVTLNGSVSPSGSPTTVHFEYGITAAYGSRTPESASIGSDHTSHAVSTAITGLTPSTTYHFRLVATNGIGTGSGTDQTFATPPAPVLRQPPTVKCKKGLVRRGGKCVKRKRRHNRGRGRNG